MGDSFSYRKFWKKFTYAEFMAISAMIAEVMKRHIDPNAMKEYMYQSENYETYSFANSTFMSKDTEKAYTNRKHYSPDTYDMDARCKAFDVTYIIEHNPRCEGPYMCVSYDTQDMKSLFFNGFEVPKEAMAEIKQGMRELDYRRSFRNDDKPISKNNMAIGSMVTGINR